MLKNILLVMAACLTLISTLAAAENFDKAQLAARIEAHPIHSLTLTDAQFLTHDEAGSAPATIGGVLRVAQGRGRLPVVVMIHGSSGVSSNIDEWSAELNTMGISTFILDGLTGRGLSNVSANQSSFGRLNLILDAYRSLEILAKHPLVDPQRIVVMGFSRGGQAALYASLKRFNALWNKSGTEFAAYIPFYPDCATRYLEELEVMDRPIRIQHGAADDYDPVARCTPYVEQLKKAGADIQFTTYANAQHGFDVPLLSTTPVESKTASTVRNCRIVEQTAGSLINADTQKAFTYEDACVEKAPHVGFNPEASQAAHAAVTTFLRNLFKL